MTTTEHLCNQMQLEVERLRLGEYMCGALVLVRPDGTSCTVGVTPGILGNMLTIAALQLAITDACAGLQATDATCDMELSG